MVWFSVGEAQFATRPGESVPFCTWETQKLMDTAPKIVLGLGLDELGYILKPEYSRWPEAIPHAECLTQMSAGPSAGPSMMKALQSIIP